MEKLYLSASTINLFRDCPRCYWLHVRKKIYRPRGPMPSIAIGVDTVVKSLFDYYRNIGGLPPFLKGKVSGRLIPELPKTLWYNFGPKVTLFGHLDEAVILEDGSCVPFDHKTKNKKVASVDDVHPTYKIQIAVYVNLLKSKFTQVESFGYLSYYYPVYDASGKWIVFENDVKKLEVREEMGQLEEIVGRAVRCAEKPLPGPAEKCEFCSWRKTLNGFDAAQPEQSPEENAAPETETEAVTATKEVVRKEVKEEYKDTLF